MKKDEIKTYEKHMKKHTIKNGELVEIINLYDGEKVDLNDEHNGLVKDYKGGDYCGNCNGPLSKEDKYCPHCGTKKGEGEFLPFLNETLFVYGPAIAYYYKCNKCKHKWRTQAFGGDENLYCPKCGTASIKKTKQIPSFDMMTTEFPKNDSFISSLKYKIKKEIELFKYKRELKKMMKDNKA